MQTIRITTAQNVDIEHELAGIGERFVAALIDRAIYIFILIATLFVGNLFHSTAFSSMVITIVAAAFVVFYDLLCEVLMQGQSIGKMVMKIRVISLNGNRPTLVQYLLRWLLRIVDCAVSGYLCGLICIVVTEKNQRLGDMAAGTVLIRTNPRVKVDHIGFMPVEEGYEPHFPEAGRLTDSEVNLIHEVVRNYAKTRNAVIVYKLAVKMRDYLGIEKPEDMNDLKFLQVLSSDYNYMASQAETTLL